MKRFMMASVCAAAVSASMALGITSAFAAEEWLCGGLAANGCKVDAENLTVITIEDMGVPASVECEVGSVTGTGTVGPGKADEVATLVFAEPSILCKPSAKAENLNLEDKANGCEKVEKVEAVDLPWTTKMEEKEWDLITEKGNGEPGYLVECLVAGVDVDDTCKTTSSTNSLLAKLENLPTETPALVAAIFVKELLGEKGNTSNPEAAKCTVGGAETGLVKGTLGLTGLTANGLMTQALEFDE